MDFSNYKAVLFDFDSTLYTPNHFGFKLVMANFFHMFTSHRDRDVRMALKGKDYNNSQAFYIEYFKLLGENNRDWYFETYLPSMARVLKKSITARPKAQELIDRLQSQGLKVGVYSDYPMVKERCEAIGLTFNTKHLWCSEAFGALKPAPRPFVTIAEELGLSPKEVLFIGDRVDTDYKGATAAGMDCVLVKTKKNAEEKEAKVLDWKDIIG